MHSKSELRKAIMDGIKDEYQRNYIEALDLVAFHGTEFEETAREMWLEQIDKKCDTCGQKTILV